jgi:Bacterial Ig domain
MKASSTNAVKAMVGFTIGALATLVLATAANAQEPRCRAKYRFIWGQHSEGWFAAPTGSPCRVNLRMGGVSTISSAQIIERPHSGTAVTGADGTIRFQPNSGFTGKDSMTVRYKGTGREVGASQEATVTFSITVF